MSHNITPQMLVAMSPEQLTPEVINLLKDLSHENTSRPMLNACIAFIILQTFFVALFYISRHLTRTTNGIEFWWFMPLAYLFSLGSIIITILFIQIGGAGRRIAPLMVFSPHTIVTNLRLAKAAEVFYFPSMTFPKLAILAIYMRTLFVQQTTYRRIVYGIGATLILWCLAGLFMCFLFCSPFAYSWDKSVAGGKCGDKMAGYRWVSVPNIVADIVILILPLPVICRLKIDLPNKIGLFLTFVVGSIGLVATIVRFEKFFSVDILQDLTYHSVTLMTWTMIEPAVCLISATLPSLRPLKRNFIPASITNTLRSFGLGDGSRTASKPSEGSSASIGYIFEVKDVNIQSTICTCADSNASRSESASSNSRSEDDVHICPNEYHVAITTGKHKRMCAFSAV